jgi:hypothetical protein
MRLDTRFATGGFTLILTPFLLAEIVLGDIPKNPISLLNVDRSRLTGGVQKVRFELATFDPVARKMSEPIEFGTVEFTQDGELKNPGTRYYCRIGVSTELKENGNITVESTYNWLGLVSMKIHVFDSNGNIIESTPLYDDTGDYRKTVYIHEFDSRGNWIKRIWIKKGGDSSNQATILKAPVEIRTITYY